MKVILKQDVEDLGQAGETVDVKDGYGRNFLIPRNMAIPATKANLRSIDDIAKHQEIRRRKARRHAEQVKDRIEKVQLTTEVLTGEEDRLFGSVTAADVAKLLEEQGVTVDKRMVRLEEPIKALGAYTVPIKIDTDVTANVQLFVQKKIQ